MQEPTGEEWVRGRVVWVGARPRGTGDVELVFEIDGEPDNLQQIDVPPDAPLAGVKKGDAVLVGRNGGQTELRIVNNSE